MAARKGVMRHAPTSICTARMEHQWDPTVLCSGDRIQRKIDGMSRIQPRVVLALMESCQGNCIPTKLLIFRLRKIRLWNQYKISDAWVQESQFNVPVVSLLIGASEEWKNLQVAKLKTGEFWSIITRRSKNLQVCKYRYLLDLVYPPIITYF